MLINYLSFLSYVLYVYASYVPCLLPFIIMFYDVLFL
jgi:hypothetical protein